MFYSQFILAKKGPLGTIWIAAHLERKLRKNQVHETNISVSVDSILFPEVPIALRLSGHLLLGVVRIYSRKVGYLYADCSDALIKIKQAFHSGAVDLPPESATAPFHSITMPESFDLEMLNFLPDVSTSSLERTQVDQNVTTYDQITLQDSGHDVYFSDSQFRSDERFDTVAEEPMAELEVEEQQLAEEHESARKAAVDPTLSGLPSDFENLVAMDVDVEEALQAEIEIGTDIAEQLRGTAQPTERTVQEGEYEGVEEMREEGVTEIERLRSAGEALPEEQHQPDLELPQFDRSEPPVDTTLLGKDNEGVRGTAMAATQDDFATPVSIGVRLGSTPASFGLLDTPDIQVAETPTAVEAQVPRGTPKGSARKRKAAMDAATVLASEVMRQQLTDTSDIRRMKERSLRRHVSIVLEPYPRERLLSRAAIEGLPKEINTVYERICMSSLPGDAVVADVESEREAQQRPLQDVEELEAIVAETDKQGTEALAEVQFPETEILSPPHREHVLGTVGGEGMVEPQVSAAKSVEEFAGVEATETPVHTGRLPDEQGGPGGGSMGEVEKALEAALEPASGRTEPLPQEPELVLRGNEDDFPVLDTGMVEAEQTAAEESLLGSKQNVVEISSAYSEGLDFLGDMGEGFILADETEEGPDSQTKPDSGWSARSRNVGKYLQKTFVGVGAEPVIFDSLESLETAARLSLNRTLEGKSRKEAARMFFETLVLKTKDYIHVEQAEPFGDILLSARPRLLKARF